MKKRIKSKTVACSGSVGTVVATKARKARVFDKLRHSGFLYRIEEAVCGIRIHHVRAPNAAVAVQRVLDGDSVGTPPKSEDLEYCPEQWNTLENMDLSPKDLRRLEKIADNEWGDAIESIVDVRKEKS